MEGSLFPLCRLSNIQIQHAYVQHGNRVKAASSTDCQSSTDITNTPHHTTPHHTTTVLRPFFQDHPGQPVPEWNFWTLWCKGRLIEADTLTIWLGTTPSGLTSAHLHHSPIFLRDGCPSCRPTNSVKALKALPTYWLSTGSSSLSLAQCCGAHC